APKTVTPTTVYRCKCRRRCCRGPGVTRVGLIDRRTREVSSQLDASLYVYHPRLVNGFTGGGFQGGSAVLARRNPPDRTSGWRLKRRRSRDAPAVALSGPRPGQPSIIVRSQSAIPEHLLATAGRDSRPPHDRPRGKTRCRATRPITSRRATSWWARGNTT